MCHAETPDFEECIMMARGFFKTASMCSDNFNIAMPIDMQAPCVMNLIFACELGLKTILIREQGHSIFTHELWKLYCHLDENTKRAIEGIYRKRGTCFTIEETLKKNNDAFREWRYSFERTTGLTIMITDVRSMWYSIDQYIRSYYAG